MKTSFSGSRSSWDSNQARRRFRISGRSCSVACADFFERDASSGEEARKRRDAERMACGEQDATHLCKRGVSLGSEQGKDESRLGLNGHRPTISSLALGRYIACRKRLATHRIAHGRPDLEMRRSLTPGHAAIDCINHTLAKVGSREVPPCRPAPFASRHDESETARIRESSKRDSLGSRNALGPASTPEAGACASYGERSAPPRASALHQSSFRKLELSGKLGDGVRKAA